MPVSPTWPGVYIQEVPSGVRTISGVSTSVALFVGFTKAGVVNQPTLCTSYSDYVRAFGEDVTAGDMTRQVKLFFLNGGTQCYVVRVADGASEAEVTLEATDGSSVLTLEARSPGVRGDLIRASVTYDGYQPEDTFNLELFRWEARPDGTLVAKDPEVLRNLSMDRDSGAFAPDVLNANSKLVTASSTVTTGVPARSYAMTSFATATAFSDIQTLVGGGEVQLSVNGGAYVRVVIPDDVGTFSTNALFATELSARIPAAYTAAGLATPTGTITATWQAMGTRSCLYIQSTDGNVFVRRYGSDTTAAQLMFGTEQGGIEVTRFAHLRPVPTGVTIDTPDFSLFDDLLTGTDAEVTLNKYDANQVLTPVAVAATPWTALTTPLIDILEAIRDAIIAGPTLADGEVWPWTAELWGYRLAIRPTSGPVAAGSDDNRASGYADGDDLSAATARANVRFYSLGTSGTSSFQNGGVGGADGSVPTSTTQYDDAYDVVRREVDLFNLMVLPRSATEPAGAALENLWPYASAYAEERRALLLMEPPTSWATAQTAMNGVNALRVGLSKQYAALYHPRLTVQEGRTRVSVGATGAIAGLMARTDSARGVWKAPAGTEADIRGVVGVAELFSDRENGVLNPKAINVVRSFPTGIVSWGARTMDGDDSFGSEYKYVPIRRLALYLEESLYRGLKWVVFEPNDEPLWAQIRLNAGAFMQGLFRQGAFQGKTPAEAYFVKCDAETTTQADRNLGIVNVWVGFAPLKPAEFVILSLQQMAGQLEL